MKTLFIILMMLISIEGSAQQKNDSASSKKNIRICPPARGHLLASQQQPLYVFRIEGRTIQAKGKSDVTLNRIKPDWIQALEVYKGDKATEEFGQDAKDGVIIITIKEEFAAHIRKNKDLKFRKI